MKKEEILFALNSGEFDSINHTYQPYDDEYTKNSIQIDMNVSNGVIEKNTITSGKFFNGKENERFEERKTEYLSGSEAVKFIESRPYYFRQRRPDLF